MFKKIDYEKELNPAQLEAVRSTQGQFLVIAGAGSGKTRVLVYRVAYLVEKGVRPDEILLLTFTRKAAEEMLKRSSLVLDDRCQKVSGGTFHSFANGVLRKYAKVLGLNNNFTILDRSDSEDAINLIRTRLGFDKTDKRFPRKRAILEAISISINKSEKIQDALYNEYPQFIEWSDEIDKINQEYKKYKCSKSLLDYDDLLVYLKDLLEKHENARLHLADKYKFIMVDEYQDTNKLQAYIACLLASVHKNIMVVGDDSQSIYSFRGANFKNIMDFPKIFKDAKIITLEENYRSTQPILNMTNEVIRFAEEKFEKNLFTRKQGKKLPVFVDARDESKQSKFIADKILELREEGIGLGDVAVLFRSGWHSNDLEVELANRSIPFVKYGGQKFVEAAHIKDVIAILRIVHNRSDQISWHRALLLLKGVGPRTAERIILETAANRESLAIDKKLLDKIDGLREFLELLNKVDAARRLPADVIRVFLKYYQPLLKEKYDDFNKRLNDLDSLERIALRYKSLEQFLVDMALEPPERYVVEAGARTYPIINRREGGTFMQTAARSEDADVVGEALRQGRTTQPQEAEMSSLATRDCRIGSKDKDDSVLTLSTIHSAKGLEWHSVFIIYVAEGHLPSYLSLEDRDAIEEERRLFYVAVTRAKENLFLLKPHIDRSPRSYFDGAHSVFTRVSRFLDEGSIMDKFVRTESAGAEDLQDISLEEIIGRHSAPDRDLLNTMEDYFCP